MMEWVTEGDKHPIKFSHMQVSSPIILAVYRVNLFDLPYQVVCLGVLAFSDNIALARYPA